jgi:uracil-DNA glycosylase
MFGIADEWQKLTSEITVCTRCPRLVAWRNEVARTRRKAYRDWQYWGKPVPGFGDTQSRVLVIGLAPGAHGANRTGRMFTGDGSGEFLYSALYRAGFANQPTSRHLQDGLILNDLYISAVCRCAPPGNKPTSAEITNCLPYLEREIALLSQLRVIVALGRIAFDNTLRIYRQKGFPIPAPKFSHVSLHPLGDGLPWLVVSYHPSRQNTQTGRLTPSMFERVWSLARELLQQADAGS